MSRSWIYAAVVTFLSVPAWSATTVQIDASRNKGLTWLVQQQEGDGSWRDAEDYSEPATALALTALYKAGIKQGFVPQSAVAHLANRPALSTDSIARAAMALSPFQVNVAAQMTQLLDWRQDLSNKAWGAYGNYETSTIDTALALEAILATGTSYADAGTSLGYFIGAKRSDGGYPFTMQERTPTSQVIPTAHAMRVLSKYKAVGWGVDSHITSGVTWLLGQQNSDGGFGADGLSSVSNPLASALVYQALTEARSANNSIALGTSATTVYNKIPDYLIGAQASDGSWQQNRLATAMVLSAWSAVTLIDTDKDTMPDVLEALLGTNANIVDSRYLAKGNGLGVEGESYANVSAEALVGAAYASTLNKPSGITAVNWSLKTGTFPTGVSLNANTGALSGTPTTAGTYNFIYDVLDSGGVHHLMTGQITVAEAAQVFIDKDIPTLPEWGMIILSLFLVGIILQQHQTTRAI